MNLIDNIKVVARAESKSYDDFDYSSEDYWEIIQISKGEQTEYWKIPGVQYSSGGTALYLDKAFRVEPKTKTISVWE